MDIGFIIVICTAIIFSLLGIIFSKKKLSIEDFISSRNTLKSGALVATLLATSMGAWILFSPAETASTSGLVALFGYALGSAGALFLFAMVGRRLRKLMPNGHTLSEYVLQRFGLSMYVIILIIMCLYMSVFLAAELTGIAAAVQMVFGIPLLVTALIIGLSTLAYTLLGGLQASLFTDRIQSWFILPLLAIIFIGSLLFLGDASQISSEILSTAPELFDFGSIPAIEFGLTLILAIVSAELFNQANWQRVFAAKDEKHMKKGFLLSGLLVIPVILIAGAFGFFAVLTSTAAEPSVSLFAFLLAITPGWILISAMVLAVILVMSSMDSLVNGLVSLFTTDMVRLKPKIKQKKLLSFGRLCTLLIVGIAILVATQNYSVLYLFLIADLLCAAAAFPLVYGLYAKNYSSKAALFSTVLGLIVGASFFPDPTFSRGNLLISFGLALLIPLVVSFFIRSKKSFTFANLKKNVVVFSK